MLHLNQDRTPACRVAADHVNAAVAAARRLADLAASLLEAASDPDFKALPVLPVQVIEPVAPTLHDAERHAGVKLRGLALGHGGRDNDPPALLPLESQQLVEQDVERF